MLAASFFYFFKHFKYYDPDKRFLFMEFYAGIKDSRKARIYTTLLLSRRLCFVVTIILFGFIGRTPIFSIMLTIQFLYWLCLILVKPFEVLKDNIIEIANETFYMAFVCLMVY